MILFFKKKEKESNIKKKKEKIFISIFNSVAYYITYFYKRDI